MLQKLDVLLTRTSGCFLGVLVGYGLFRFWDWHTHPLFYVSQSAPWYVSLLPLTLLTTLLFLVTGAVKLLRRHRR